MLEIHPIRDPKELHANLGPKFYFPLGVFLAFFLLVANITVQKILTFGFFIITAGDFIYPFTYILDGIIIEVYGYALSRKVIWMALILNILFAFTIFIAIKIPHTANWQNQAAFTLILGQAARICIASFIAFIVGEFINSYIMAKLKIFTEGKHLWFRSAAAVMIGQGIDTTIFSLIAFIKILNWHDLIVLMGTVYIFKFLYQIIALPLIYFLAKLLKKKENLDIFDHQTNFNPFKFNP